MHLTRTIWLVLLLLAGLLNGCAAEKPVILDGGRFHPHGVTVSPNRELPYTVDAPVYIIPEDTFRALVTP